ncbi:MAG TPA: tetratricopeptide repeat protein, partial [Gemmataceae bacterium]|nr:tetratricopeptide repeat protein [Gemmataceae bacterium]
DEALRLRPNDFWAHYHVGLCDMSLGRSAEAVEAYGACLALRPDSVWAYTARASALNGVGRYEDAEHDLTQALKQDPDLMPARLTRGLMAMLQHKPEKDQQALDDFGAVLAAPPEKRSVDAAYYRGILYRRLGRREEAEADFDRVARENPKDRRVYRLRAGIHFLKKEELKGLDDLTAVLAASGPLDPTSAAAYEGRGRLLGQVAAELAQPEARPPVRQLAVEQFRKASELGARSADFLEEYGLALAAVGDNAGAIEKFTEALRLKPGDAKLLTERGGARLYTGDPQQVRPAGADFAAALRRDPTHAEAHSLRGYVLAETKDTAGALREAHLATLYGNDYGLLHNVSTVYAALATSDPARMTEFEDMAIDTLRRAVYWWRRGNKGEPSELTFIQMEGAFSQHLRDRQEFKDVVEEAEKP